MGPPLDRRATLRRFAAPAAVACALFLAGYLRTAPGTSHPSPWGYRTWAFGALAYSDILALHEDRGAQRHPLPYLQDKLEYPVLMGLGMWWPSVLAPERSGYFALTYLALALCGLGALWFLASLPAAGVEYYFYDQLGSAYSDQPDDPRLWTIERFADEVEQVRTALGLTKDNFVLLGHSWGGILALEYALRHPQALKGLVISNMMASIPAYNEYARKVLMPQMDPLVLAEVLAIEARKDYDNPRYEELLFPAFYTQHILRMPLEQWPDPVLRSFAHLNKKIYVPMQGPSEMGASGVLEHWDRTADLKSIAVPTLVIGAQFDTMDPKHMEWMAKQIPRGRFLYCPKGSHLAMYDDQETYFAGLVAFLRDVSKQE